MILKSNDPIFIQVYNFYKNLILCGVYKKDSYLPTIREVALEFKINPNTVVKAFNLLVNDNLVNPIQKKGFLVIYDGETNKKDILKSKINEIIELGFTKEEIFDALKEGK